MNPNATAKLLTSILDLTHLSHPHISFWHSQQAFGNDHDTLRIFYRTSSTNAWIKLADYNDAAENWTFQNLELPNPSATYQLAFEGKSNEGYGITLDDIIIYDNSCPIPTDLSVGSTTDNSATLSWTGEGNFNIQYKISASSESWQTTTAAVNSIVLSGLTPGTKYEWQVQKDCDNNNYSEWVAGDPFYTTCPVPTELNVTAITTTGATLSWAGIATGWYDVQYKIDIDGDANWIDATTSSINNTTIDLADLTPGTAYLWQVRRHCIDNHPSAWVEGSFTTLCPTPTPQPTDNISATGATIHWTETGNFNVQYREAGAPAWQPIIAVTGNSYEFTGLSIGTTYEWQVQKNCGPNLSEWSAINTFSTTCPVPADLKSSIVDASTIKLTWTGDADGNYQINYKKATAADWQPVITVNATTTNISGLDVNTEYNWQIRKDCGHDNFSEWVDGTVFEIVKVDTTLLTCKNDFPITFKNATITLPTELTSNHTVIVEDVDAEFDTLFNVTLKVNDGSDFTLTCPDDIEYTLDFGECEHTFILNIADAVVTHWLKDDYAARNMAINVSYTPTNTTFGPGEHTITWKAIDPCGYIATCQQKITVNIPDCPDAVDYEGNHYPSVWIDCNCWTTKNLQSTKYADGSDIPDVYTYVSDANPDADANRNLYGNLYTWQATTHTIATMSTRGVTNPTSTIQGICPTGWYLPTAEQYTLLSQHGRKALRTADHWIDGGGNNSTGFSALPAGRFDSSVGDYRGLGADAHFWATGADGSTTKAYVTRLLYYCSEPIIEETESQAQGQSVRCIKAPRP